MDPLTRGDPTSPLRWTCKSRAQLTAALTADGWRVSSSAVGACCMRSATGSKRCGRPAKGSSIRIGTRSSSTSTRRPRRSCSRASRSSPSTRRRRNWSASSRTAGREWQPTQTPEHVQVHDFPSQAGGQGDPVRRLRHGAQRGLGQRRPRPRHVGVRGRRDSAMVDHDGPRRLPRRDHLLITADAGGSNGYRTRAWKTELQRLADDLRLRITVCHFPPGTSKWNKIEHRLFCHITTNWRGRPLRTFETIVDLIGHTQHRHRAARAREVGQAPVSHRRQGDGGRDARRRAASSRVSWRLELRHPPPHNLITQF